MPKRPAGGRCCISIGITARCRNQATGISTSIYSPVRMEARAATTKPLNCRIRVQSFVFSTSHESRRALGFVGIGYLYQS